MVMQQTLTLEEYLALPEEKPYREFIHGRAVAKPMTNTDHGNLANSILFSLTLYAHRLGGKVAPEISVLLGEEPDQRVLLPDAAYWAPGRQRRSYPSNAPTVAVEVRSPSQTCPEQREKCRFYVEHGVEAAWLVDPDSRTVEVFEGGQERTLTMGDALTSVAMRGFELSIAELFRALDE